MKESGWHGVRYQRVGDARKLRGRSQLIFNLIDDDYDGLFDYDDFDKSPPGPLLCEESADPYFLPKSG